MIEALWEQGGIALPTAPKLKCKKAMVVICLSSKPKGTTATTMRLALSSSDIDCDTTDANNEEYSQERKHIVTLVANSELFQNNSKNNRKLKIATQKNNRESRKLSYYISFMFHMKRSVENMQPLQCGSGKMSNIVALFVAKPWSNDLEDMGQAQMSVCVTHPLDGVALLGERQEAHILKFNAPPLHT